MGPRRCTLLALLLAASCTKGGEELASSDTTPPAADPAADPSSDPSQEVAAVQPASWRPAGQAARREHVGSGPEVTRLTESVYWIEPTVLTALAAELAEGQWQVERAGSRLRIESIAQGTIAADLGLVAGDLVIDVDGASASAPEAVRVLHQAAREARRVDVRVQRGGQELWLRYHVDRSTRRSARC